MAQSTANTQDLVPIEEIRNDTVILRGGKILKVLMVDGVNFSLKSEEEQNIITYAYQNFLNGLDFPIQIVVHSRKINIEKYLDELGVRQKEEPTPLLQNQIGEYREFVRSFVKDNAVMEKSFFVVVPFSGSVISKSAATGVLGNIFPFFGSRKSTKDAATTQKEEEFTEHVSQLDQRVNQVVAGLESVGLEVMPLTTQSLVELFYNFYNPETVEKKGAQMNTQ